MAEFQNPDILGEYLRGAAAPGQLQAQQQQNTMGGLQIDQLRMALSKEGMIQNYASQLAGQPAQQSQPGQQRQPPQPGAQGPQAGGAQNGGASSGGIQNGPQQQVSGQPSDGPVNDGRVNTMMALDVLQGRDPLGTASKAQEYQQKQRQLQVQGPMALAESVSSAPDADQIIKNNPSLQQQWIQMAPKLGLDPFKDLNPANARLVATYGYNQLAGSAGLPPKAMPNPLQTKTLPDGRTAQVDPLTGKETIQEASPLEKVIGANGQPTLVPTAKAAGMTPFNQSIFGASNITDQQKDLAYQTYVNSGGKLPTAMLPRSDAGKSQLMAYIADRAKQEGNTAVSIAANGQATQATQGVVSDFTKGKSAQSLNAINTAVQHMNGLSPLIDAMGTGNVKVLNQVTNAFKQQVGVSAPTNYAALKEFVGGEVAKAVLPGGGGEAERKALLDPLNAANSPQAIHDAVQQITTALAGKTEALRNQWDVGTRGTQGSFDKFLMPATKKALGIADQPAAATAAGGAHPPLVQSLLDKYK